MSDLRNRQSVLAHLIRHPSRDEWGQVPDKLFDEQKLTWREVFTSMQHPETYRRYYLYQSSDFWNKLAEISDFVEDTPEALVAEIISPFEESDEPPISAICRLHGLDGLLNPALWQGDLYQFDRLWGHLIVNRAQYDEKEGKTRKAIAADGGYIALREAMSDAGLNIDEYFKMVGQGQIQEVLEELDSKEIPPDESLVFGPLRHSNASSFHRGEYLDNLPKTVQILRDRGIPFNPVKLWQGLGRYQSIAETALKEKKPYILFSPVLWADAPEKISDFYEWLEQWDAQKDYSALDQDITHDRITEKFPFAKTAEKIARYLLNERLDLENVSRESLLADQTVAIGAFQVQIQPVTCPKIFENYPEIVEKLKDKNEHLSLNDLRAYIDEDETTLLLHAARLGHFPQIIATVLEDQDQLKASDILGRNKQSLNVLGEIRHMDQLELILNPKLWVGQISELKEVFDNLNKVDQGRINLERIEGRISVLQMRNFAKQHHKSFDQERFTVQSDKNEKRRPKSQRHRALALVKP